MSATGWEAIWRQSFAIPEAVPGGVIAALCLIFIFSFCFVPFAYLGYYTHTKFGADLQARVGPNRAGPAGFLQPLADWIKLVQKASPKSSLWLFLYFAAALSTLAAIPLGTALLLVDTDLSAFVPIWAATLVSIASLMMGLSRESIAGPVMGFRFASQGLSGLFPATAAVLCAGLPAGGFRWSAIVATQGFLPTDWRVANPFQLIAFIVFLLSGLVLLSLPPMDGTSAANEASPETAFGVSGWRLAIWRMSRFYAFFFWTLVSVVLFLGGWRLPVPLEEALVTNQAWIALQAIEAVWLLGKVAVVMLLVDWLMHANPRSRVDQVTDFSWKILSPASLIALVGCVIWETWRRM
jgi:NADH:ubiquinone oxidoreductase subunit H